MSEAWEECGAHIELQGEGFTLTHPGGHVQTCFLAHLRALEPSPEGRPRLRIDPQDAEWRDDHQVSPSLRVLRERGWL